MDHFINIYSSRADDYHQMIAPEDADGNLARTLRQLIAPGQRLLDLGTGTGRLPLLLAQDATQMVGLDLHRAMLLEQQRQQTTAHCSLAQGDMRHLPFPSAWVQVVMAGWAIGHLRGWYANDWQTQIGQVLNEMHRVATPGGVIVIMETLSTGSLTPVPPTEGLAEYYAWLEREWGFTRTTLSTDYQFASVEEAIARSEFFFGPGLTQKIRDNHWARIPEWTGVWSKSL
jgi:ubiquinone/menaquinone biosynthesis C-methylase UbiE